MRPSARPWSIFRRLTLLYTATTAALLVLAAVYLYLSQVKNLEREDDDFLANQIMNCRRLLRDRPHDQPVFINEVQTEAANSLIKYYIRFLDDHGAVTLETPGMSRWLPPGVFPAAVGPDAMPRQGRSLRTAAGETCLLMAAQARAGVSPALRTLQVGLDVSEEAELITGYRLKLLGVVLLGSSLSWIVGAFVTRRGLRPIQDITQATERITASQLHERIVAHGWPTELSSLARSFDQMLDRLEDAFKRLSQFSADLAHELRTPINNLRGEAGVTLSQARTPEAYRATLESSLEEYARLARLIDNLLFLARADGRTTQIERVPCAARPAIEVVREYYEALAEDRGVRVRCEGEGVVAADPALFRQAVSNLLANALNATPAGGRVDIRLEPRSEGGLAVRVEDTGCGIAPEHLPRVFDRLYRVEAGRPRTVSGAGLGLAIVKSIMTLHGGSVEVQSRRDQGSRFTLKFPAAPGPAAAAPDNLTTM